MEKKYMTLADFIEELKQIDNPSEVFVGMPHRNGYGDIYWAPIKEIALGTDEYLIDMIHKPLKMIDIIF